MACVIKKPAVECQYLNYLQSGKIPIIVNSGHSMAKPQKQGTIRLFYLS
jgi:hypothetical protein